MHMLALRMSKYSSHDEYIDASTGVLKNRLGITAEAALEEAEATFASVRSYELVKNPLSGTFDLAHLKALHGYLFQDIYDWAGQPRIIDQYMYIHPTEDRILSWVCFLQIHSHIVNGAKY